MPDASFAVKPKMHTAGPFRGEPMSFACAECGERKMSGRDGLRGYAVNSKGEKLCYDCCAKPKHQVPHNFPKKVCA